MSRERASRFVWGALDKPRFEFEPPENASEPVIKSASIDEILDDIQFEWLEE